MSRISLIVLALLIAAGRSSGQVQATTSAVESPYVEAIRLIRQMPAEDRDRIDSDAPLDEEMTAFLKRNGRIFELLRAGAAGGSADIGAAVDNAQTSLSQMNTVRSLAVLGVLRARLDANQGKPADAVDDLLAVMALGRNTTGEAPALVFKLVDIGAEALAIQQMAATIPALSNQQLRELSEKLQRLPRAATMADMARGERQFGASQLIQQLPNSAPALIQTMAPFYDAIASAADQTPPLSADQFRTRLTDAASKIDGKAQPAAPALAQQLVPAMARAYVTLEAHRVNLLMLEAGIAVARDGPDAAKAFPDPYGEGPFEYHKTDSGFELQSKLVVGDRPAAMQFNSGAAIR